MEPKIHKRVKGKCSCKPPFVCSVVSNSFWCGKCGKDLEPLTEEQLAFVRGCKNRDEILIGAVTGA